MTRTPLLARLQRLYRDFAEHEATGRSIQEIQAERLRRPSRREFLKIAGLGAAGTLVRPDRLRAATQPHLAS